MMDVNVASMFLTCRAVVPLMRERGGGKIVNISSGTPFRGVPFLLHYVTSKGAIVAFTRALAKELGKDSIHVNCVAPGFTMTDGRRGQPGGGREAARRLGRGADDPARPGARGRRRRGRLPLQPRRRRSSPARRWSSTAGSTSIDPRALDPRRRRPAPGTRVVYDVDDGTTAHLRRRSTSSRTTRCVLAQVDDAARGRLAVRCDRVDFPPGGVAYRHTHPGPGIRVPALRRASGSTPAGESHDVRAGRVRGSRAGRSPVLATASEDERDGVRPRACCSRASWAGKRTIRYVDPADEEKPKLQRADGLPRAAARL